MADLFSPLVILGKTLPNRIVMAPTPSGHAHADGFVHDDLVAYYQRLAAGGVGLIISEPLLIALPPFSAGQNHIGIYDDAFIPALRRLSMAVRPANTRIFFSLELPSVPDLRTLDPALVRQQFAQAAWRSLAAGSDGIMLSSADGGVLHQLLSPLSNQRDDAYGGSLNGRVRLTLEVIDALQTWFGRRLISGFRLLAEEFTPGGMSLQDARVVAKRVTAAGVRLLDVTVGSADSGMLARFPGWAVPLAGGIKRIIPDVPVSTSGQLGEPHLADSIIRDGSADLVMLRGSLRNNPDWPHEARRILQEAWLAGDDL